MSALFISDLHLCEARPLIARLFLDFLKQRVVGHGADLYILGDLFDYWIGDEDLDLEFNGKIAAAIREVADTGNRVFLMHGNRDFLIGSRFCDATGATPLIDPVVVDLDGTRTLLAHGDTLCTDDLAYQEFRRMVRNAEWQRTFLSQPVEARRRQAEDARVRSESAKQDKTAEIMDVNADAVEKILRDYNYPRLIHGHTHRPAHHRLVVDGHACERWVLQDWYLTGGYLQCDAAGCNIFPVGPA